MNTVAAIVLFALSILPVTLHAQHCLEGRYGAADTLFSADQLRFEADREYGRAVDWLGDTVALLLDVYAPLDEVDPIASRPAIVYIHGGGFHAGSKSNQKGRDWAIAFARRGYVVFAIDYRIGWPAVDSCAADTALYMQAVYRATQDTRAALRWILATGSEWRIDPDAIFLLGTSAGSGASMFGAYSTEGDLAAYLSEGLGPLDGSGNTYTETPPIAGILTKSAAIDDLAVLSRKEIPHLMFHGTCDLTVPYTNGAIFHCYAPDRFIDVYGSGDIADALDELGRCYTLYRNVGQGHGAVADDTVVLYGADFMRSIFCEECQTMRIERISSINVCSNRSGKNFSVERVYPNPGGGLFYINIAGPQDQEVDLEVYSMSGSLMQRESRFFLAPVQQWVMDFSDLPAGVYFVKVGAANRFSVQRVILRP